MPLNFPAHPDRAAAIGEAHARPPLPIEVPSTIHLVALALAGEDAFRAVFEALFDEPLEGAARHTIRKRGSVTVKWERHTEFASLLLISPEDPTNAEKLLGSLGYKVPEGVQLLIALRVKVHEKPSPPPKGYDIGGVLRSGIEVSSSFRAGEDGFIDYHVAVKDVGPAQLGRRIQRMLEAETYRTMALIGLPLARRVGPVLSKLEARLAAVTETLNERGGDDDAKILDHLQSLSAETEALRTQTRFRFSASRAYAALVDERLASLAEEKIGERPTLSGFIRTRLNPAVRTIVSAEARQEELSAAVGRALNLLRARLDVSLNQANQDILRSMNERQHRQLIIQEAVESLSVIAISYYLLGILLYPVKSLNEVGWLPVSETLALGILAPFVAVGVFATLRGLRHRWTRSRNRD
jgi:uncharacterized membrane-anchored protein